MKVLKGRLAMGAAILVGLSQSPPAKAQTGSGETAATGGLGKRLVGDYGFWSKYRTPPYAAAQVPYGMGHNGQSPLPGCQRPRISTPPVVDCVTAACL